MEDSRSKESFTILMDTNAVTAITLYLEACEIVQKEPDEIENATEMRKLLKRMQIKQEWLVFNRGRNGIKEGCKAFKYLKEKQKEYELYVYFPLIGEVEVLHLFIEREFDHVLTRKGVPFRLRTKRPARLFVDFDYSKIYQKWKSYEEKLKDQEIQLMRPEKEGFWQETFHIYNLLMKYISMGSVDLLIYATAIYLRADEIYTHDTEFKSIIRQICRPPNPTWRKISDALKGDLKNMFSSFTEGKLNLPNGVP